MKKAPLSSLASLQRVLLVAPDGAHFPAAAATLREAGFHGTLRAASGENWRVVTEGKCHRFLTLPAENRTVPARVFGLLRRLANRWPQAMVWAEPDQVTRRHLLRALAQFRPVFVFAGGALVPYAPGQTTPSSSTLSPREQDLAIRYLAPVLHHATHQQHPLVLGVDGDGIHLREATGVQWYRRHLFAALCHEKISVELRVLNSADTARTAWELPWAAQMRRVPPFLGRSHERVSASVFAGRVDCFHWTFFDPPPFTFDRAVGTIYDLMPLARPDLFPPRFAERLQQILPFWRDECRRVICISEATRRDAIAFGGIAEEKLVVIPPGMHPHFAPRPQAEIDALLSRLGIRAPYLLAVGSLATHKNLHRLCQAFARAKAEAHIPHQLVLVGRPAWNVAEALAPLAAARVPLRDIVFTGYLDFADVPTLYSGAEALCQPSLYEGYGLPVQEALCCGCPVLLSNTTALPEVAGDAGLYWDPENVEEMTSVLTRFCTDAILRQEYREKALARAATFSTWHEVALRHRALYEQVAHEH